MFDVIEKARSGDSRSFDDLYRKVAIDGHGNDKVERIAKHLSYLDSFEDIMQDIKLRIWKGILTYDISWDLKFEIYVWKIIKNSIISKHRRYFKSRIVYNTELVYKFEVVDNSKSKKTIIHSLISKLEGDKWMICNFLMLGFDKIEIMQIMDLTYKELMRIINELKNLFGNTLNFACNCVY